MCGHFPLLVGVVGLHGAVLLLPLPLLLLLDHYSIFNLSPTNTKQSHNPQTHNSLSISLIYGIIIEGLYLLTTCNQQKPQKANPFYICICNLLYKVRANGMTTAERERERPLICFSPCIILFSHSFIHLFTVTMILAVVL